MAFFYSSVQCGIKYTNRDDFALLYSDIPCCCSALFTNNKVQAAPVLLSKERANNTIRAILVNAGNANACTGRRGYEDAVELTGKTAELLKIPDKSVLNASTGVIGLALPVKPMLSKIPELVSNLETSIDGFSKAILTTDTHPKVVTEHFTTSKGDFTITAACKGAGMIAPDMATLLAFVTCTAPVEKETMDDLFRGAVKTSLNSITIDGDMSTNDSAYLLYPSVGDMLTSEQDIASCRAALYAVMEKCAYLLVSDGEGVTKCVTILVRGAKTEEDARKASKSIAESFLVKTALFGNDPNWGRIACAAGYSGADFNPDSITISIASQTLFCEGAVQEYDTETLLKEITNPEYTITVDLGAGNFSWKYLTSDISYDYVRINAEYTT